MGKMKIINFSKTIAAYDLKVGRCIELNDIMNLHQYQRSSSFLYLRQRSLSFQSEILFSQKLLFETKYHVKDFGVCVCVCIPILITTFPEWLSGTELLPHTPGAVRPSSLCL